MEEKKNKSIGSTVVIVVLSILILGMGGFIIYDKILMEDSSVSNQKLEDKAEKNQTGTIKKLTKDSQEVKDLMNTFVNTYNCDDQKYLLSLNEKSSKLYMAYTRAHNTQSISCSKTENLVYNSHTCGELEIRERDSYFDDTGHLIVNDTLYQRLKSNVINFVYQSEFDKKVKELFGENIEYSYDDIIVAMGCNVIHYDQTIGGYIEYTGYNCGGSCSSQTAELKDIIQKEKELTLIVDVTKSEENTNTIKYNFSWDNNHYIFVNME